MTNGKKGQGGFWVWVMMMIFTILNDMPGNYTSVYIRNSFDVTDPFEFYNLKLSVVVDDGFAAYLNGFEIARFNAPDEIQFDSLATESHEADDEINEYIDSNPRVLSWLWKKYARASWIKRAAL